MDSLAGLRERRDFECRLTPDRALASLAEAEAFLRDRGMLSRTADSALPSLYEACHEEPYKPGGQGFAAWPATKWPWFAELTERGYLCVAVHRGKNLLIGPETAALLDPICRAEIARMRAEDAGWRRLLDHLAAVGPSLADDIGLELGLKRQELKALRAPLERCGAIVARSVALPSPAPAPDQETGHHTYASELCRWDQAYPGSAPAPAAAGTSATAADVSQPGRALADLIVAAVRAAVIAPEPELRRWFSWQWYWSDTILQDLISSGRIRRLDGYVAVW